MLGLLGAVLLVLANGFFVAAEFALVKVRATQLDLLEAEGSLLAGVARELVRHLDGYLSATQLGITLTSLALGWIGEPAVASLLEPLFHLVHLPEEWIHEVSVFVGFSLISALHIVVGEVAPKSLAIAMPVEVSLAVSWPLRAFYLLFWPVLVVLNASSNGLLRMVGIRPAGSHELAMPAEELRRIAEESAAGGQIGQDQGDLLSNVFSFSDRTAHEIMVPRHKVDALDIREPVTALLEKALAEGHSRYPLVDGDLDEVIGVVHQKDLLPHLAAGRTPDLVQLARKPLFVPSTLPAQRLVAMFQRQRTHLAFVLDEHGGIAGIATLEDALEELVGDIQDEHDEERPEVEPRPEGGWSVSGVVLLEDLAELVEEPKPDVEASTVQGWLLETLGRIPKVGDVVPFGKWDVVVTQVDRRAAERVQVRARPEPPPDL